jgi:hypothetical protein
VVSCVNKHDFFPIKTDCRKHFQILNIRKKTASVVLWSQFLTTDAGAGSIPGHYKKKSSGSGTGSTQPREYN